MTGLLLSVAQVALDGLWQGLLLVAVVAVCLDLLPKVSPAQRFTVWVAAFVIALGLPFLGLTSGAGAGRGLHVRAGWAAALAVLWFTLVAVRTSRLLLQAAKVRRIWLAAQPVEVSAGIVELLAACPRRAVVCASDDIEAPSVIGFWSPRLLVPSTMLAELNDDELRHIVMHECEHLRRGDDWLNLAQKVALAVFPLNLGLLFVDQRLGLERELACDAGVVSATGAPLAYASCLTRLAERRLGGGRLVLALSAWARRSDLAKRVYTLLEPVHNLSQMGSRGALAALACILLATANGVAHLPHLVSFGAADRPTLAVSDAPTAPLIPAMFHPLPDARLNAVSLHSGVETRAKKVRAVRHRAPRAFEAGFYNASARQSLTPAYLVPVKFTYTYAAVPFEDGWLIVQL